LGVGIGCQWWRRKKEGLPVIEGLYNLPSYKAFLYIGKSKSRSGIIKYRK
jgi:hypothetical protein